MTATIPTLKLELYLAERKRLKRDKSNTKNRRELKEIKR